VLEGLEPIRKRLGMDIGSIDPQRLRHLVLSRILYGCFVAICFYPNVSLIDE